MDQQWQYFSPHLQRWLDCAETDTATWAAKGYKLRWREIGHWQHV